MLEYRFSDSSATQAVDTSGNRLHGTFMGGDIQFKFGLPGHGYAIALDGENDFINVGDPNLLDLRSSYTLMGWINYRITNQLRAELMEKGGSYWLNIRLEPVAQKQMPRAGGLFNTCSERGERYKIVDSPMTVAEDTWTHLASTYNAHKRVFSIFVNGQLSGTKKLIKPPVCVNNNPLAIGAKYVPNHPKPAERNLNFLDGLIDDVRVYNNALSAAKIRDLMLQP